MAQWFGSYTGRTHGTKVAHFEATMKVAVESLRSADLATAEKKLGSVMSVADRLLNARLKMLGARIERFTEGRPPRECIERTRNLVTKEESARAGGVPAILKEFGVDAILGANANAEQEDGDQTPPAVVD